MAKKKTETSFSILSDALDKIAPDGALIDDSPMAKIDEWIPTGCYILNAVISGSIFGGVPNRRSLVLSGDEGAGKTFIALSIGRLAQELNYDILYFDSEGSIDKDFVTRLGVDTSRIRLQPVNTIEEVNFISAKMIETYEDMKSKGQTLPKILVVLDSLGNLSSEKEVDDANEGSNKRDMTKQQAIRKLFRVNGLKFAKFGIPLVVVAHNYAAIGAYVPTKVVSGGGGILYNASIILELSKKKLEDKEAEQKNKENNVDAVKVGVTISVKPIKQRFARPIRAEFHIPFYKKPNPFVGLEKFVSWDSCGIMRGKALTQKEFSKLDEKEKAKCKEFEGPNNEKLYALSKDTARTLVCKHLKGESPLSDLFTDKIFTKDVLKELDEKIIKPTFSLPSINSLDDLAELAEELESEKEIETIIENGEED